MAATVIQELMARLGLDIEGFTTNLDKSLSKLDSFGRDMTKQGKILSATITAPLVAVGAAAFAAAMSFDAAFDSIRAATGATGPALESLKQSFKAVFSSVPASADTVATAIGDLNTRLGLAGPPLESLATQMVNLARVTGSEVGPLIAATTRLFGDWSIATEKQSGTMDYLFKTSQQTGIGVTQLMETVVQFGAPLRALGFSLEDAAALMGKWEKEGVNMETVLSGLRFALAKFAAAGQEPEQALRQVQAAILGAGNESKATAIAFDAFGKRAAVDMSRAIIEGRFNIDDLVKSLKSSKETINSAAADTMSFSEQMTLFKNQVQAAIEPVGVSLVKAAESALVALKPFIEGIRVAAEWFSNLDPAVRNSILVITGLIAAVGPVTFVLGQMVMAVTSIVGAIGGAAGLTAIVGSLTSALAVIWPIVVAVGVAWGSWELMKWVAQNQGAMDWLQKWIPLLGDFIRYVDAGRQAVGQWYGEWRTAAKQQEDDTQTINELAQSFKDAGIAVSSAGLNMHEYAEKLRTVAKQHPELVKTTKDLSASTNALVKSYESAAEKTKRLKEEKERLETETRRLTESMEQGWKNLVYQNEAEKKYVETAIAAARATAEMDRELQALNLEVARAAATMPQMSSAMETLIGKKTGIEALGEAMGALGIKTTGSLSQAAASAEKAFNTILASGVATPYEIQQAWVKYLEAQKAIALATTGVWTESDEAILQSNAEALGRMEGATRTSASKQESEWSKLGHQVSTIFTDMSKNIMDLIWGGTGSVKEIFLNVFSEMGKAVTRFVVEYLEGKLFKALADLVDSILPGVGKTLAGVFGSGTAAAGNVAGGAAGTATSAAGGVAGTAVSGAAAWVGAIGSAVSAGAAVVGDVILARIHTDTGRIEESTRYMKHYLGADGAGSILGRLETYLPNLSDIRERITEMMDRSWSWLSMNDGIFDIRDLVKYALIPTIAEMKQQSRNITVNFNVDGRMLANMVATEVAGHLSLQGARA